MIQIWINNHSLHQVFKRAEPFTTKTSDSCQRRCLLSNLIINPRHRVRVCIIKPQLFQVFGEAFILKENLTVVVLAVVSVVVSCHYIVVA